jgi:hypothetical protein
LPNRNPRILNGTFVATYQSPGDGGSDEDVVMVAVSLPVVVIAANCASLPHQPEPQDQAACSEAKASQFAQVFQFAKVFQFAQVFQFVKVFQFAKAFQIVMPMFRTEARSGDTDI